MSQQDLQIRLKTEEMIQYGYAALRQFPKSEKHVLSAEIRSSMFSLLRLKQLSSMVAHARHGGAGPAISKRLNATVFKRGRTHE